MARSFPPAWDAPGMAYSLEVCGAVAAEARCRELDFVPAPSVLEVVRCGARQRSLERGAWWLLGLLWARAYPLNRVVLLGLRSARGAVRVLRLVE